MSKIWKGNLKIMKKQDSYEIKYVRDELDTTLIEIYYKGNLVFTWNNAACTDFPEDLIWERDIQMIFDQGVELGKRMALDKKTERN